MVLVLIGPSKAVEWDAAETGTSFQLLAMESSLDIHVGPGTALHPKIGRIRKTAAIALKQSGEAHDRASDED